MITVVPWHTYEKVKPPKNNIVSATEQKTPTCRINIIIPLRSQLIACCVINEGDTEFLPQQCSGSAHSVSKVILNVTVNPKWGDIEDAKCIASSGAAF